MKALFGFVMLLTLNNTYASGVEGKVKIVDARYDSELDSVVIGAQVSGLCIENVSPSVRLRGCTDFFFPNKCFLDVTVTGEACDDVETNIIFMGYTRDELNMKTRRFSDATLVIQNNKGKSQKFIRLPINH